MIIYSIPKILYLMLSPSLLQLKPENKKMKARVVPMEINDRA